MGRHKKLVGKFEVVVSAKFTPRAARLLDAVVARCNVDGKATRGTVLRGLVEREAEKLGLATGEEVSNG
jgi:hypothetical protein